METNFEEYKQIGMVDVVSNGGASAPPVSAASDAKLLDSVDEPAKDIFVSKNGIKFKLKTVSSFIIYDAGRKIPDPQPPRIWMPEKERHEENPNDPDYLAARSEANWRRGQLIMNLYVGKGTEVIHLPEGMANWQDTEWSEDISEAFPELDIPVKGTARYVAWLKYTALDQDDFNALNQASARFSGGITEEDVEAAEDSFRDNTERPSDTGDTPTS